MWTGSGEGARLAAEDLYEEDIYREYLLPFLDPLGRRARVVSMNSNVDEHRTRLVVSSEAAEPRGTHLFDDESV